MSTGSVARYLPPNWMRRTERESDPPPPPSEAGSGAGRSLARFVTLRRGMDRLPEALLERMAPVAVHAGHRLVALAPDGDRYLLRFANGATSSVDGVLLALPAREIGRLLGPALPTVREPLDGFRTSGLSVVGFVFDPTDLGEPPDGGGVLVPERCGLGISAVTWLSAKWDRPAPRDGGIALRVFARADPAASAPASDPAIVSIARDGLRTVMKVGAEPRYSVVFRHEVGRPWYGLGHLARLDSVRRAIAELRTVQVCGSAFDGTGLPAAIRSGRQRARDLLAALGGRTSDWPTRARPT